MKTKIDPAKYKKLLKLAKGGGSKEMIGTVLGSLDPAVTEAYLAHLKANDPDAAPAGWAVADGEDDDLDDFGLDEEAPEPPKPSPTEKARKVATLRTAEEIEAEIEADRVSDDMPAGVALPSGQVYPERFRMQTPDGETVELECFSKSPKWGFMLRHPVPTDMRTVNMKGKDITVDYLALQRNPKGTTEGVLNEKLVALIDLGI